MKKLTLLLLLVCTSFTLYAQRDTKNDILTLLKREGYVPAPDEDGDIKFKIEGINYYALIKPIERGYDYVEIVASFTTETPYDKLLTVANGLNRDKYVCKCTAFRNDGENGFSVSMEFITDHRINTEFQMSHALRLLPGWVKEFERQIGE